MRRTLLAPGDAPAAFQGLVRAAGIAPVPHPLAGAAPASVLMPLAEPAARAAWRVGAAIALAGAVGHDTCERSDPGPLARAAAA